METKAAIGLLLVLGACGGEPDATLTVTSAEINEHVLHGCPATFRATNGERCGDEKAVCTLPIACSTLDQQATCTCDHGRFACKDGLGYVAPGAVPRCVAMEVASTEACAPTLEQTQGSRCETVGHSCAYAGALCPERPVQNMDVCTCLGDGKSGELVMKCRVAQCSPLAEPGK